MVDRFDELAKKRASPTKPRKVGKNTKAEWAVLMVLPKVSRIPRGFMTSNLNGARRTLTPRDFWRSVATLSRQTNQPPRQMVFRSPWDEDLPDQAVPEDGAGVPIPNPKGLFERAARGTTALESD